ncbi:MAG: hypothetical protein CL866_00495 [Cycloclasticus sp.]|nr:hypothetical protein [Cycloclasticus sp.]MBG95336.1 hypothetical protein [Cycloclasticus sp.]HAI97889.1 hypothetical protein [Methylococcaceae bacterium]|tara:strand:- start:468 stop:893 length:426 start_codon:yes stop_codon:yes gene_type:complete
MKRRVFLQKFGALSLGVTSVVTSLSACQVAKKKYRKLAVNAENELVVSRSLFEYHNYVLLDHPVEDYPIYLAKIVGNNFEALLMRCTHQQCTTEAKEGYIVCPCHGAKFEANGRVLQGPAILNLQKFSIRTDENNIYVFIG